jgi:hypothetical protein
MVDVSGTLDPHSRKIDGEYGDCLRSMSEALIYIPSFVSAQLELFRSYVCWRVAHKFYRGISVRLSVAANGVGPSVASRFGVARFHETTVISRRRTKSPSFPPFHRLTLPVTAESQ